MEIPKFIDKHWPENKIPLPIKEQWAELIELYSKEQLLIHSVVKSLNADELIKSLGSPDTDNEYRIKADKQGKWWIDHKHVGSGEPLKQWLTGKP